MTLHSYLSYHMGERIRSQRGRKYIRALKFSILAINAKGVESIKPKAKGSHDYFKKIHKSLFQSVFELASK
jgi:fido (protein-threonine AMPylation protein)